MYDGKQKHKSCILVTSGIDVFPIPKKHYSCYQLSNWQTDCNTTFSRFHFTYMYCSTNTQYRDFRRKISIDICMYV